MTDRTAVTTVAEAARQLHGTGISIRATRAGGFIVRRRDPTGRFAVLGHRASIADAARLALAIARKDAQAK